MFFDGREQQWKRCSGYRDNASRTLANALSRAGAESTASPLTSKGGAPWACTVPWNDVKYIVAQVMYGVSAASRHFGGVVLLRLHPLAAGEILIGAG